MSHFLQYFVQYFLQYIPHLLSIMAIGFVFVLLRQLRRSEQKQQEQHEQLGQLSQQLLISRSEIKELRLGVLGLGKKLAGLETVTSEVSEKQEELQLIEPESKLYSRAVKMVELGANVEEVMQECELPLAEAELLVSLHRGEGSGKKH